MATEEELYDGALRRLNRIGAGQSATADQKNVMARNFASLHGYLLERGYINYDLEDTPVADEDSIITILAYRSRMDFSAAPERIAELRGDLQRAYQVLFANNGVSNNGQSIETEYF